MNNSKFNHHYSECFKKWVELEYGVAFKDVINQVGTGMMDLYQMSKNAVTDKINRHCSPKPVLTLSKYVHKSSGNEYTLLCVTNTTATKGEYVEMAVYVNNNNEIFSRPMIEFAEKFSEIKL